MSYKAVMTDDGLEIRNSNENVVWGPSEEYSWPPNEEMMEAVFEDANVSNPNKAVFRLISGLVNIKEETSDQP